jgi:predicted metal-dependent hydrolase
MPPAAPRVILDAALEPGRAAFNRGAFFQAHELWEDVWRVATGAERELTQGLIQIAAGLHHLQQGRPRPAARLLARGLAKLPRDRFDPFVRDVEQLVRELETLAVHLPDPTGPKL